MNARKSSLSVALLVMLLCLASSGAAEETAKIPDQHVDADRARELYRRSIFAHGYIHGYEDGFHVGNFDYQTGHAPRDLRHVKQFRDANAGYRREFGNREEFRVAYREGFSTGYADAIGGRDFRAVSSLRRAAAGLEGPASPQDSFDHSFRQGYESGKVHGEVAGRDQTSYKASPSACSPDSRPPAGQSAEFCDGYARGYLMGYDDGYVSRGLPLEPNITAKNTK